MKKWLTGVTTALLGTAMLASSALAAVTFDPVTGKGFVGKGDVQLEFGWNNAQLQSNASNVKFQAESEVVTEVSWECHKFNPQGTELLQERQERVEPLLELGAVHVVSVAAERGAPPRDVRRVGSPAAAAAERRQPRVGDVSCGERGRQRLASEVRVAA